MGIKISRAERVPLIVRLAYLLNRIPRRSNKSRLGLLLDLEWIFSHLCHEASFTAFSNSEHPLRIVTRDLLLRVFPREAQVLDLGCGSGDLLAILGEISADVVGVDQSAEQVDLARLHLAEKGLDNVRVFATDGVEYLQGVDAPVDVVVMSHILEHLEDPSAILRDVAELCSFVYVEVPDFESQISNEFRRLLGRPLIFSDLDHIWEFDRREITELLEGAGLMVLETDHRLGMLRLWCSSSSLDT